jgi:hypothetical protein
LKDWRTHCRRWCVTACTSRWRGSKRLRWTCDAIEARLQLQLKQDPQMQRIAQIPGVGLLTATAAIATMGESSAFKSGREFCAWLGLVPKQTGSGGKVKLLGISKRGDTCLRTLLIHGARSVIAHAKEPARWLQGHEGSASLQRGLCSAGGQDGQNDLGHNRQSTGLRPRLQERQAPSDVMLKSRKTRQNNGQATDK